METTGYPSIPSITKGPRQSNIELLRILSMFMVLMVHANFFVNGSVNTEQLSTSPFTAITRIFLEMACVGAVNVFVLISGWFGIKPSIKGFSSFAFQCLFFILGFYFIAIVTNRADFSSRVLFDNIFKHCGWFIKAYIGLYILAPLINSYIEKASKRSLEIFLIGFFSFEFIYGWIENLSFIAQGYCTFSFIGLYVLARYLRTYAIKIHKRGRVLLISTIVLNTLAYIMSILIFNGVVLDLLSYINPLVILGSAGLIMYFSSLKIKNNKIINFIAASSFAAYLFHGNLYIMEDLFKPLISFVYQEFNGFSCLAMMLLYLICFYLCAVVIDQIRILLWKQISKSIK